MSHSPQDHVPMDPGRVHILDPLEMTYWCNELHCTEAQLTAAVATVGEHVTEVRQHLASHAAVPPSRGQRH
jgi:Protein of unknown function (DUF3606)